MNELPMIAALFQYFPRFLFQSAAESQRDMQEAISRGELNLDTARQELLAAIEDPNFDWLFVAEVTDFIFLTDDHRSFEVKVDFFVLVMELCYPECLRNAKDLLSLNNQVQEKLQEHKQESAVTWMELEQLVEQLSVSSPLLKAATIVDIVRLQIQITPPPIQIKMVPPSGYHISSTLVKA